MITGPATTWCYVADMERAITFYRDLLGLPLVSSSPFWSVLQVGSLNLGLHAAVEGNAGPYGAYGKGWFLGLEVSDIRALRQMLISNGVEIKGGLHDVPGAVILDFLDPDGNTLEAYQAGVTVAELL